jgi:hypothetical protein
MKHPLFAFTIGAFVVEAVNLMAVKDFDNGTPMMAGVFLLCLAAGLFEAYENGRGRK